MPLLLNKVIKAISIQITVPVIATSVLKVQQTIIYSKSFIK